MAETVAVIVVFITLVVFGLVWWIQLSNAGIELERDEIARLRLVEMTKEIMNLPELQCSLGGQSDTSCLDVWRLQAVRNALGDDTSPLAEEYEDAFFGITLQVDTLYPRDTILGPSFEIFDFQPPDTTGQIRTAVPVVLYDPVTDRNSFAMLVITQHLREGGVA